MKEAIAFYVILTTTALVKSESFYIQQQQYKDSSSSFQNGELVHNNQSSGFYSQHGDLEGKIAPKVNLTNRESQYVNPKFQNLHHQMQIQEPGTGPVMSSSSSFSKSNSFQYGFSFGDNAAQTLMEIHKNLSKQLQQGGFVQPQKQEPYPTHTTSPSDTQESYYIDRHVEQQLRGNISRRVEDALRQQQREGCFTVEAYNQIRHQLEQDLLKQLVAFLNSYNLRTAQYTSSTEPTSSTHVPIIRKMYP